MSIPMIPSDIRRKLVQGIARKGYHLLLGAGASMGAVGGDEKPLPSAPDLAAQLCRDFGLKTDGESVGLPQAYELIEDERDSSGRTREQYLRYRFSNCRPSWQWRLGQFRWRRIWSLNIDDVVESSYSSDSKQPLQSYSWQDSFADPDISRDEVQLIHLHGSVHHEGDGREADLIFSILEYFNAASSRHAWHHVFGSDCETEPMLVVGATLADEYDLADFLRRGNVSLANHGFPSIVVLRKFSAIQRKQFEKWGFRCIEAAAEDFFQEIHDEVAQEERKVRVLIPGLSRGDENLESKIVVDQFQWLRSDVVPQPAMGHDFYAGHDPLWTDIVAELDAEFAVTSRVVADILPFKGIKRQSVHLIHGSRGAGKSTALLRIARQLMRHGFDLFRFRGEERPNNDAICWLLRQSDRVVILVDGLADFSPDFAQLVDKCAAEKLPLVVVAAERETRLNVIYQDFEDEYLFSGSDYRMGRLRREDVKGLLEKLEAARRLGRLTRSSYSERMEYFLGASGGDLLVALLGLEGGRAFSKRLRVEYMEDVRDDALRDVYGTVCLAYSFGYPVPLGITAVATGLPPRRITQAVAPSGQLYRLVNNSSGRLAARHRSVASMMLEHAIPKETLFQLSQDLARALSPFVTLDTIRARTLPFRILRQVSRAKILKDWIGVPLLSEWYEGLVEEYGWNSRFWEQRALAELERLSYQKARSYAEEAVRIHRHAFSLNTLGTVLMRMATSQAVAGSAEARDLFWTAVTELTASRELADGNLQHPFVTFFTYAIRHARREINSGRGRSDELLETWNRWMQRAEFSRYYKHARTRSELREFQRQWLLLMVEVQSDGN